MIILNIITQTSTFYGYGVCTTFWDKDLDNYEEGRPKYSASGEVSVVPESDL